MKVNTLREDENVFIHSTDFTGLKEYLESLLQLCNHIQNQELPFKGKLISDLKQNSKIWNDKLANNSRFIV